MVIYSIDLLQRKASYINDFQSYAQVKQDHFLPEFWYNDNVPIPLSKTDTKYSIFPELNECLSAFTASTSYHLANLHELQRCEVEQNFILIFAIYPIFLLINQIILYGCSCLHPVMQKSLKMISKPIYDWTEYLLQVDKQH